MEGDSVKRLNAVQLGFSIPFEDQDHRSFVGHNLPLWRDWDGGQIGGRPSWLQPRDIPNEFLSCSNCQEPLCFICQLYAPADEVNPNAFHRSLYVFGCPSPDCVNKPTGSIRVIRTQLPRENIFYPDEHDKTWTNHLPESWEVQLCKVCGQRGKGKCPIQGYHFCGKHHQREHKRFIFDKQQQPAKNLESTFLPSVCSESELVVEEEPMPGGNASDKRMMEKAEKVLFPSDKTGQLKTSDDSDNAKKDDDSNGGDGDDDEDKNLEQEDLNKMSGARTDKVSKDAVTMEFYSRITDIPNVQEQCLRYLRWPDDSVSIETASPLWISTEQQPETIPNCPHCGAERKFEFQLMPQMLHYLLKDHEIHRASATVRNTIRTDDEIKNAIKQASSIMAQAPPEQIPPAFADAKEKAVTAMRSRLMGENGDKELAWGVIAVYSCTASCDVTTQGGEETDGENSELGAYREEFAWKQPSLD